MKRENDRGITLVTLVITIIIMLILAGVVINLTMGDNGILKMGKYATKKYENAQTDEEKDLLNLSNTIEQIATSTEEKDSDTEIPNFSSQVLIYDSGDFESGGSSNVNYATKSYKLTQTDISTYNGFLFQLISTGATGAGYYGTSAIVVPEDSLKFVANASSSSTKGQGGGIVFWIPKQTVESTISATVRGHCRIMLYGLN